MGRVLAAALFLSSAGCVSFASTVASPTALEHQLLGVYEELDRDLIHASSVRAAAGGPGSLESLQGLALEGRALQRFHADDLAELKAAGCLAETTRAEVVRRPCAGGDADEGLLQRRLQRVVHDENRARRAILNWAAHAYVREQGRQTPTSDELSQMRATYHRLLKEAAAIGELFEVRPGEFEEIRK